VKSVSSVAVDRVFELFGEVDDVDCFKGASVWTDSASGAEVFVDDGFFFGWWSGNYAVLFLHVDRADFCAEVSSASLGVAAVFSDDCDSWHKVCLHEFGFLKLPIAGGF